MDEFKFVNTLREQNDFVFDLEESQRLINEVDLVRLFKETNGVLDRNAVNSKDTALSKEVKNEFANQFLAFLLNFSTENAKEEDQYLTIKKSVLLKEDKLSLMIQEFLEENALYCDHDKFFSDIIHYLREQGFCEINENEGETELEIKFLHPNVERCINKLFEEEDIREGVKFFTIVNKVRNSVSLFFNKSFIKNYLTHMCTANSIMEVAENTYQKC